MSKIPNSRFWCRAFCNVMLFCMVVTAFLGCKPSLPSDVLSRGVMEDVMYDYHLSQSLASQQSEKGEAERIYEDAVLQKYSITKQMFDRSLSYYMRHTDELANIYENIEDRMRTEAGSLGASVSEMNGLSGVGATGDTANVWNQARSIMLLPKAPYNQNSFSIKCDSSFHKGDAFILSFDCDYIYQDGMRNMCALLAITLDNDSIVSTFTQVSMASHQTLRLTDFNRIGIKAIRGYFILSKTQSPMESETTLQLAFVNNIQLIRMHTQEVPSAPTTEIDTSVVKPKKLDGSVSPSSPRPNRRVFQPIGQPSKEELKIVK